MIKHNSKGLSNLLWAVIDSDYFWLVGSLSIKKCQQQQQRRRRRQRRRRQQ